MRMLLLPVLFFLVGKAPAQSIEVMPGTAHLFADIQFFKPLFEGSKHWSVFSRTRGTLDYHHNADILSAGYFNYTTKPGVGMSIVTSLSSAQGGIVGTGVHYFKAQESWSVFALLSTEFRDPQGYVWFSIAKYRPVINESLRLYSSLELYHLFNRSGHVYSTQRVRIGVEKWSLQFGLATNLWQAGEEWDFDESLGVFIRKEF